MIVEHSLEATRPHSGERKLSPIHWVSCEAYSHVAAECSTGRPVGWGFLLIGITDFHVRFHLVLPHLYTSRK